MDATKCFVEKLRKIRLNVKMNQEELAFNLGISTRQYQRLESGETNITMDKLMSLSEILKANLIDIYKKCKEKEQEEFNEIKHDLFIILDLNNLEELKSLIDNRIKNLIENKNPQLQIKANQLLLFAEGILSNWQGENEKADTKLQKALSISIEDFEIEKFQEFYYDSLEIRILLNLAYNTKELYYFDLYKEIILFLNKIVNPTNENYTQVKHSYAMLNIYENNYELAIEISEKIIEDLFHNNDQNHLYRFYYILGVAYFNQGNPIYNDYFDKTLRLLAIYNLNNLYDKYKIEISHYADFEYNNITDIE